MKQVYKVLGLALFAFGLFLYNNSAKAADSLNFHFSQDQWVWGEGFYYQYIKIQFTYSDGAKSAYYEINKSNPSISFTLNRLPISVREDVQYVAGGTVVNTGNDFNWDPEKLCLSMGPSPAWPLLYYGTNSQIILEQNGVPVANNTILDFNKDLKLKIIRKGYPGHMPIYIGKNSGLSSRVLFVVPSETDTMTIRLSDYASTFSQYFGGDNQFVNEKFSIGYYGKNDCQGVTPFVVSRSNVISGLKVTGLLETDPQVTTNLCPSTPLIIDQKYIKPDHELVIKQGSEAERTIPISQFPYTLNYAELGASGFPSQNYDIWVRNTSNDTIRTQHIIVSYLLPAPDTTHKSIRIRNVSCADKSDGKIFLTLPNESSKTIRLNYIDLNDSDNKGTVLGNNGRATLSGLKTGHYLLTALWNVEGSCYAEMGPYEIGIADTLTIDKIENTRIQSCSYKKDAQLTIIYRNGAGDVDFKFGNNTAEDPVIDTLRGNTSYTFIAIDSAGCESDPYTVITKYREPLNITLNPHPINCFGQTATENLNVTGGNGGYLFTINGTPNIAPGPYAFSGTLHVPEYAISVTDSKGCIGSRNASFPEPPQLKFEDTPYKLSNYNGFGLECHNDLSGRIILNHTGGTEPIQFTLSGNEAFVSESDTFKSLNAGTYKAFMKDAHNCVSDTVKNMVLTQPDGIEFANIIKTSETCRGTGDAGITLDILGTPGTYTWFKDDMALEGMKTKNLSGVDSGNYRLNVTYNNGACNIFSPVYTILPKKALNYVYTTHQSCADRFNGGEIRIGGITGGTAPYAFLLNNNLVNTPGTLPVVINNLNADDYNLEIRDANYQKGGIYSNQCKVSKSIVIEPKSAAYLTPAYNAPLCHGDSNGKIAVTVAGPDDPIVTAWYNSENDSVGTGMQLTNIPAGNYHARITDSRNCVMYQNDFKLNEPALLKFSEINLDSAACTSVSDGKINLTTPIGGTPGYQYSRDGGTTWQANPSFSSLSEGVYHILSRDAHLCSVDTSISIAAFKPNLSHISLDSITCYDAGNGRVSVIASGSKTHGLGYTYRILPPSGPSTSNQTGIFRNLNSGNYQVYAQDHQNCITDTLTYNFGEPPLLTASLQLVDSASCGQPTGKLQYLISGGNGGNSLLWKNQQLGETNDLNINALATGVYELTVTDRKECKAYNTLMIPDRPAPVISSLQMIKQSWCDQPLGAAQVKVSSGSKPYSYLWNDPAGTRSDIASNLNHGTYRVRVTDRYQCTDEETITINDGPEITMTNTVSNPHCGHADGKITLQVNGGVDPYFYQWPDSIAEEPLEVPFMENLFSGKYDISITDSVGCHKLFSVTLDDLSGPKITSTSITKSWCGLPHGTAKVLASGGTLPYSYTWTSNESNQTIGANPVIANLKAGDYKIAITDQEECKAFATITIADSAELKPVLSMTLNDSASCGKPTGRLKVQMNGGLSPYSYLWETGVATDSLVNVTAGKYHIKATDTRGCKDSLEITLIDRKKPVLSFISKESAYCSLPTGSAIMGASLGKPPYQVYLASKPAKKIPFVYNMVTQQYTGKVDSLLPLANPYRLLISDAYGCESAEMGVLINNHDPLTISLMDIAPVSCYGLSDGQAQIFTEHGFEPYTYEWSINTTNSNINSALPAGPFQVKVTDARGCIKIFNSASNPISQSQPLTVSDAFITTPSCFDMCDASIAVNASGGNGNYLYTWNNTDLVQNVTGLCPGEHMLEVTDGRNCSVQKSFTVINPDPLSETELEDTVKVCYGQQYLANPGSEWNNVSWISEDGITYDGSTLNIENQGTYYMSGYSAAGCLVKDTLTLIMTNDLLDAQFLMMSQAYVGDTVVIVEVTWPLADTYTWTMPEEARLLYDNSWVKEISFDEAGIYYIELKATLAGCMSVVGKHIEILEVTDPEPGNDSQQRESLIQSFVLYPNPVDIDLNVDVKLSEESDIRIEIYSLTGGILTRILNDYGMDTYTLDVNLEDLLPGTYIIKLIAGHEVKTKMLIVQ